MLRTNIVVLCAMAAIVLAGPIMPVAGVSAWAEAPRAGPADSKGDLSTNGPAAESDESILKGVPDTCILSDGSIDHDVLLARIKQRVGVLERTLSVKFAVAETPHFLVISDTNQATNDLFAQRCELLYGNLCTIFGAAPGDRIWPAKCALFLFRMRTSFDKYAMQVDSMNASANYGYYRCERYGDDRVTAVKILLNTERESASTLLEHFVHEATHAFYDMYKTLGHTPRWLQEGLAEYMTTVNDKTLRAPKVTKAAQRARTQASIGAVFLANKPEDLGAADNCVAMTLVDYLITAGKPKFKKLVDALKEGKTEEAALAAAYGLTLPDLEKRWRIYVVQYLPKQK